MPLSVPYGIRALALSHLRAWPTAFWTGAATALAAGLQLPPTEWAVLAGLTVVCGATVRSVTAQMVAAWLSAHPEARLGASASDFDAVTLHALSSFA